MKSRFSTLALVSNAMLITTVATTAAPVTKSAAGTDLTDGASWGGSAPGTTDTATWDPASLGAGLTLATNAAWDGIKINGAASDIDISGAGALTLGTGGIDASAGTTALSIGNNIVLNGNQAWTPGTSLTSTGNISGTGTLTFEGDSADIRTSTTFLNGTVQALPSFSGVTLSELTATSGLLGGAWVASNAEVSGDGYLLTNDGTTARYWLEGQDLTNTKAVQIELKQVGSDITVQSLAAKYKNTGTFPVGGVDFDTPESGVINGTLATADNLNGYGGHTTTLQFGTSTVTTLSGNNTYDGGTVVNGGLVLIDNGVSFNGTQGGSLGTGPVTINSGGTIKTGTVFVLGGGNATTREVNINGGTANIEGAGAGGEYIRTLNMTGGTVMADSATVYFRTPNGGGDINSLASADQATISAGLEMTWSNLTVNTAAGAATDDLLISGNITQYGPDGTKAIIKNGAGTLALSGTNTFTGGITINEGTLMARSNAALGTGAVTLGETANDASLYLGNQADLPNNVIVSAAGSGQVTIGGDNSGGGNNAATFGGTLTLNRPTTLSGEVSSDRLAIDGQVTGNVGTLTISGGSRTTLRSTANDFVGDVVVTGAGTVLQIGVASAAEIIPDTSSVTVATGAILQLAVSANGTETIDALDGAGTIRTYVGQAISGVLAVGGNDGTGDFSGALENGDGTFSFTKVGTGTQTLSGSSTHTGPTLVTAGTLFVTGSLGDTSTTVEGAAIIGGTGSIDGDLTFEDGAILHVVNLADALTVNGNVSFANFDFDDLVGFDVQSAAEDVYTLLEGDNIDLTNVAYVGLENALVRTDGKLAYFQEGSLQVVVIPEPAAALLGGLGLLALASRRRRHA